jgi:hypothetical protein
MNRPVAPETDHQRVGGAALECQRRRFVICRLSGDYFTTSHVTIPIALFMLGLPKPLTTPRQNHREVARAMGPWSQPPRKPGPIG